MNMSPLDHANHALHLMDQALPHLYKALDALTLRGYSGSSTDYLRDALKDCADDLETHMEEIVLGLRPLNPQIK